MLTAIYIDLCFVHRQINLAVSDVLNKNSTDESQIYNNCSSLVEHLYLLDLVGRHPGRISRNACITNQGPRRLTSYTQR